MKNLTFGLFIICITCIASCGAVSSKGTNITGTISDAPNMKVYFDKMGTNNNTTVLAQTDTDDKGNFTIKLEEPLKESIYRMRIGAGKVVLIVEEPASALNIKGNLDGMRSYDVSITGSESAKDFAEAMNLLSKGRLTSDDVKDYITNTKYPLAGMQFAMNALGNRPEFFELHKTAATLLGKKYPTSEYLADYTNFGMAMQQAATQGGGGAEAIQVGMPAPNISLKSPDGKNYSLADLKGKVVLLDFWASWCGPCRKNNPHVVEIYNKYKDKGFTVYSVSLDGLDARMKQQFPEDQFKASIEQSKKKWIDAIQKDQLTWPYHVSELTKWDTPSVREYGVTGIPKTFLIGRDGKIAAVNPRFDLEEQLLKIL